VFHSEQSGHWPCQRELREPQDWQTYLVLGLAMLPKARGTKQEHKA